jgi:hypothetical protein
MMTTHDERQSLVSAAWATAQRLEREEQLAQAEEMILGAIDHLGAYAQVAHLYELRMGRLARAGDREGAVAAFHRSNHWMDVMASGATSGGEGAALTYQAQQHRINLVKALGFDPAE